MLACHAALKPGSTSRCTLPTGCATITSTSGGAADLGNLTAGSLVKVYGVPQSGGSLLAYVIVCAAVWILRVRRPNLERPFKTPFVPVVPILGIIVSLGLMASLNGITWLRLVVWLIIGQVIYFTYSVKHSKVRNNMKQPVAAGN